MRAKVDPQLLATQAKRIESFTRPDVAAELSHLTDDAAFVNENGCLDPGWSCRTQAFLLSTAIATFGLTTSMMFGKASFILGPTAKAPSVGMLVNPHVWVAIDNHGYLDLSPDFRRVKESRLKGLGRVAIVGRDLRPRGRIIIPRTPVEYENSVALATYAEAELRAIYFGESFDEVTRDFISGNLFSLANSPLVDRLQLLYSPDILAKATRHLIDFVRGKTTSLRGYSQDEAWARVNKLSSTTQDWLAERLPQALQ